ncbi:major facilitator superfamily domain-containing protein [Penicillium longicatenatum]|nr:major facilitator superfamily domain-containing protein [Penicillium longicatenatum]
MVENNPECPRDGAPSLSDAETIPFWRQIVDQGAITKHVPQQKYLGSGTEQNPFIVTWIPDDPSNPKHYGMGKKIGITIDVSTATLTVGLGSSAYSGGVDQVEDYFNIGSEVATLDLSLYVVGFALGPIVRAFTGRQYPFWASFGGMAALFAGCAGAQNIWTLIILRFLAGAFGDMFEAHHRGLALSLFAAAPFMEPVIGPIIGGFVGMTVGWRWIEGALAIFTGVMWFVIIFAHDGDIYLTKIDIDLEQRQISFRRMLGTTLLRPWILLFREPIVLIMSLYIAIIYGALFMMFAAFPIVYQEDRWWN